MESLFRIFLHSEATEVVWVLSLWCCVSNGNKPILTNNQQRSTASRIEHRSHALLWFPILSSYFTPYRVLVKSLDPPSSCKSPLLPRKATWNVCNSFLGAGCSTDNYDLKKISPTGTKQQAQKKNDVWKWKTFLQNFVCNSRITTWEQAL